jgi:hypothetical protein
MIATKATHVKSLDGPHKGKGVLQQKAWRGPTSTRSRRVLHAHVRLSLNVEFGADSMSFQDLAERFAALPLAA